MMTLRRWLKEFTEETGEVPTHVVVDWSGWGDGQVCEVVRFSDLSNELLDRVFSDEYGGYDAPGLCAWSPSWVLFSDRFDGASSLQWVPRIPIAHQPIRPGGG